MQIPIEEILSSVILENPWWETGTIPGRLDTMPRRAYLEPFRRLVENWDVNRAVVLLGPRRVGKTVMIHHVVARLIAHGTDPKAILYVSIDTPTYTNQSLQFFLDLHARHHALEKEARRYIVFDEIQYLPEWERHLKSLVDRNPHVRFVASGSAAAALKLASAESGAGRFTEFMLPPLSFAEYLSFVGKLALAEPCNAEIQGEENSRYHQVADIEALNREFVNYINYGGYPEAVISEAIRLDAARFIKTDIIDKVLLRDLPQLYGITNIQELNKLFTFLAYQSGQEVSLESLSQSSGISKPTIDKYMKYLEAAFLIFRIRRIDQSAKGFSRERTFKVFLTNPSMRAALFSPLNESSDGFGHLVETAIFGQWFHSFGMRGLYYARWKSSRRRGAKEVDREIDLVNVHGDMKPFWLVEIKWSDKPATDDDCWRAVEEFCEGKTSIISGVMTTRTHHGTRECDGLTIDLVPSSVYGYVVGRNIAETRGYELTDRAMSDETSP